MAKKKTINSKKNRKASKKSAFGIAGKLLGKCTLFGLGTFALTFAIYMTNAENKIIYYVVRPLLNKHYNSQVRDRRI